MAIDISELCISPGDSIRQAIACIDRNGQGIALVVGEDRRLLGVITDGDIRRSILSGADLDSSTQQILSPDIASERPPPVTAPMGAANSELLRLMNQCSIRHIPLVDSDGRVAEVALMSDLVRNFDQPVSAMIMAGGLGTRLRPLTDDLPKPMLPVGDKPLIERVVEQLKASGIRQISVATHYKPEAIASHFGDGEAFGVEISYIQEDSPLGTAGAVGLIEGNEEPLLVINGDVLTGMNFRAMADFHVEQRASLTVAVKQFEMEIPYGVVEVSGEIITGISEKPVVKRFINAGIYLLSPEVRQDIKPGQPLDMPELITQQLDQGRRVVSFPVHEYWLDIGQPDDYARAQAEVKDHLIGEAKERKT